MDKAASRIRLQAMTASNQKVIRCSYEVQNDMLEILVSEKNREVPE